MTNTPDGLPKNTVIKIDSVGNVSPTVWISTTLSTPSHVDALRRALDALEQFLAEPKHRPIVLPKPKSIEHESMIAAWRCLAVQRGHSLVKSVDQAKYRPFAEKNGTELTPAEAYLTRKAFEANTPHLL